MIAEAIDTAYTIGTALLAWIAVAAAVVTVALVTAVLTGAWAWRTAWRGVTAAMSLVQHSSAPELPHEPHSAPQALSRPAPAWADTNKEAA